METRENNVKGTGLPQGAPQQTWLHRAPFIILALISVMVFVSIFLTLAPKSITIMLKFWGTLIPVRYVFAFSANVNPLLLIFPPITYQFLHGGFLHLFLNSMFLLAFGTPVALKLIGLSSNIKGSLIFLLFFLGGGIFSAFIFVLLHLEGPASAIGASGSISALMAAAIRVAMQTRQGMAIGDPVRLLPLSHPVVVKFSIAIIALNLLTGLLGNLFIPGGAQIAWDAHIAGYVFGLFTYPLFEYFAKGTRDSA